MKATSVQVKEKNFKWLIPLILLILSIILEGFFGSHLFNLSHDPIIKSQNFLSELGMKIFNNDNKEPSKISGVTPYTLRLLKMESYIEELNSNSTSDDPVEKIDENFIFGEVLHFLNTNNFYVIICAILFNFINIYKILILCNTVFLANFISSTLCFIFHSPRPFMVYSKIKPIMLFNDWGSPNTQVVVLIAFGLSLFEVLRQNKVMIEKIWAQIIVGILLFLLVALDVFLLFASGNIAINQIIFSVLIAVVTYQIIFILFKVDLNKSKQLYEFLRFKTLYYICINGLLLAFLILLHNFIIDESDVNYYGTNIDIQEKRLPSLDSTLFGLFNYRKLFYLNNGNFCNVICFLMNIVAFLSMKAELKWTYKNNYTFWSEGNFEKTKIDNISFDSSGIREYSSISGTQWNHNGFFKGLVRFILLILMIAVCVVPSALIYCIDDKNEMLGFVFLITLPFILLVFGIFYLFKVVFLFNKLGKTFKKKSSIR